MYIYMFIIFIFCHGNIIIQSNDLFVSTRSTRLAMKSVPSILGPKVWSMTEWCHGMNPETLRFFHVLAFVWRDENGWVDVLQPFAGNRDRKPFFSSKDGGSLYPLVMSK